LKKLFRLILKSLKVQKFRLKSLFLYLFLGKKRDSGFIGNINIPEITPIEIRKSRYSFTRINLLIPSINKEHIFGGISTAIKFFESLISSCKADIRFRIIITDAEPSKDALTCFDKYKKVNMDEDSEERFQIICVSDRYNKDIPVTENDFFIASAWWTAYIIKKIVYNQNILFKKSYFWIYFIQDFEPGFYPWGTKFILSDSTYYSEFPVIAVFNSKLLKDYFEMKGHKFYKEFFFQPKLNSELNTYLKNLDSNIKKRQILVYGRPSVDRNDFYSIVQALRIWTSKDKRSSDWSIFSAGEIHPNIELENGKNLVSLGKLSIEDYAKVLCESSIGISLMISPHPSYPPLEMAHFGVLTITNSFENKNLSSWHSNINSIENYTPDKIAETLKDLIDKFDADRDVGIKAKSFVQFYTSDEIQFDFTDELIGFCLSRI